MTAISDKIMRRVVSQSKRHDRWVCTPTDFPDIGSRAAVDQALSRLVKRGDLRRIGHGLYDKPRYSPILKGDAPANIDSAVEAIVRRDGIRIMKNGIYFANRLRLTNAVPAQIAYVTDGATRNIQVDGDYDPAASCGSKRHALVRKARSPCRTGPALARAPCLTGQGHHPDPEKHPAGPHQERPHSKQRLSSALGRNHRPGRRGGVCGDGPSANIHRRERQVPTEPGLTPAS